MKTIRTLFTSAALSLCIGTAFAANSDPGNIVIYPFTQSDPAVHEQVSCVVTNAKDADYVKGRKVAEIISGFNGHKTLTLTVGQINSVYFDAYHNPNRPKRDGLVEFTVFNSHAQIQCYKGTSAPGDKVPRTQMPGPYNAHTS